MKRGDLFRVYKGSKNDPKKHRVFLVVSRQLAIAHGFPRLSVRLFIPMPDGKAVKLESWQKKEHCSPSSRFPIAWRKHRYFAKTKLQTHANQR